MKTKIILILLSTFILLGFKSKEEEGVLPVKSFDDRTTRVYLVNYAYSTLRLDDSDVSSGEWSTYPPNEIPFNATARLETVSNSWLSGTEGWVRYKADDGSTLTFSWENPYTGYNSYSHKTSNEAYALLRDGEGSGNNAVVTWTIRNTSDYKTHSTIIMADPQAWRMATGDPNSESNRGPWLNMNLNVANAIASHEASFHIVNGDLTEFGREDTYNDYANIYRNTSTAVFEALGNHDYGNNVGDCATLVDWSSNGCAREAVARMAYVMKGYYNNRVVSNYSEDRNIYAEYGHGMADGRSLAYSWDYGDIHYVQLQNFPTYAVNLPSWAQALHPLEIKKSLNWLKRDLDAARERGKQTILNFHDAKPSSGLYDDEAHFINESSSEDLTKFKKIITSHNVRAIFVGHTHQQAFCHASDDAVFGNVPVYTAGALFNGDYYHLDVNGKDIRVEAYNGSSGSPVLVRDLGLIGAEQPYDSSCSKY